MPKSYGTPVGYEPPNPNRQRTKVSSVEEQQREARDYLKRTGSRSRAVAPSARPRGSSSKPSGGQKAPPVRIEKAIKDAGG